MGIGGRRRVGIELRCDDTARDTAGDTTFDAALDPALPTIVAGDFNESERGDAVAWLGERGFSSVLPQFDRLATTWPR